MAKFLFVYRGGNDSCGKMSPEEMQQAMQKWGDWFADGAKKGWLIDGGDALKKEGCVVHSQKVVTDGPFVETKEIVGGFSVIQAETLASAAEIAKGCPMVQTNCGFVEVRPMAGYCEKK